MNSSCSNSLINIEIYWMDRALIKRILLEEEEVYYRWAEKTTLKYFEFWLYRYWSIANSDLWWGIFYLIYFFLLEVIGLVASSRIRLINSLYLPNISFYSSMLAFFPHSVIILSGEIEFYDFQLGFLWNQRILYEAWKEVSLDTVNIDSKNCENIVKKFIWRKKFSNRKKSIVGVFFFAFNITYCSHEI